MPTGDSQPRIQPDQHAGQEHTRDAVPAPDASEHTGDQSLGFDDFDGPPDSTEVIRGAGTQVRHNHNASVHERTGHVAEFTLGGTVPRVEPGQRISKRAEDLYLRLEGNIYGPVSLDELESLLSSGLLTGYETISGDLNKWTPLAYHPRMIASRDSDLDATHSILSQYSDLPAPVRAEDSVPTGLTAILDDTADAPPSAIVNRPSRIGSSPTPAPQRETAGRPSPNAETPPAATPGPEASRNVSEHRSEHGDDFDPQAAETLEQPVALRPQPHSHQENPQAPSPSHAPPQDSAAAPAQADNDLFSVDPLHQESDSEELADESDELDPDRMSDTSVANDPRSRHLLQRAIGVALFLAGAAILGGIVYLSLQ